uniref:Dynein regulatory complex protein 10 n=1 Tax=Scophthalmus maximus TaxID=52904 RepID=A0A8D3AEZ4_SCOMX
ITLDRLANMSANRAPVLAMTKSKTQSEDALKNLLEKRRLSVEAQRISSIVENCISQLEIAATLPAILCLNSDSSVVDEELMRALRKHQLSETRLERETLECIEQESEGEDEEARKRVKTPLEKDIKDSVRDLLRLLRSCPDAISGLREEQGMEVGESECELIMVLKMFHSHMVDKLQTSLDEDLQRISRKKMEVTNLQESLEENNKQIAGLSLAQKCPPQISKKQASMQQEMGQLNIQLNNLMLENRRAERTLRKVSLADLELNQIEYESGEEELRSLEKRFSVLESEYDQIMERRRLAEEKRQTEMRELELKIKAAIFAQAWWRGYSTRKALKNRGKSKTAKKGKGKKR